MKNSKLLFILFLVGYTCITNKIFASSGDNCQVSSIEYLKQCGITSYHFAYINCGDSNKIVFGNNDKEYGCHSREWIKQQADELCSKTCTSKNIMQPESYSKNNTSFNL